MSACMYEHCRLELVTCMSPEMHAPGMGPMYVCVHARSYACCQLGSVACAPPEMHAHGWIDLMCVSMHACMHACMQLSIQLSMLPALDWSLQACCHVRLSHLTDARMRASALACCTLK
eukprot:32085-Chlamydomonas_euryale.AAC.7